MRRTAYIFAALALCAVAPAIIVESEPNNNFGTADVITRGTAPWSDLGVLSFGVAGDNDWFVIQLNAGETITAITTPLATPFTAPDTVMALLNPSATAVLVANDDIGGASNRGSGFAFTVSSSGLYVLAITGFHTGSITTPAFYTGTHTEQGNYQLTIGIVPEPATMAALGLGLAVVARRRRRR